MYEFKYRISGEEGRKGKWFTKRPFQINSITSSDEERKCTLLHQLGWIPHRADTLRPWRERVSLLSAKYLLQNSAKAFRLNTGEISAWGTAQLQVEKKKKPQCSARRTRHRGVHLALSTTKLSPHHQRNPPCTLWSREWFPTLAGSRSSGSWVLWASKIRPLGAHCTLTASVKLAIISGAWEAFLFVSTALSLGFDIYTKWNYILNYKTPCLRTPKTLQLPFQQSPWNQK